jgi:drug/metabolite transporter (DMT)-like permease
MQNRLEPIVVSAGSMTVAAILSGAIAYAAPLLGGQQPVDLAQLKPDVLGAILALGLVNTFGAYLIFYSLVSALGAARTSMVTYVIPVVGLLLGTIFLAEQVDLRLILGALLIVGGVGIVNLNIGSLLRWPRRAV